MSDIGLAQEARRREVSRPGPDRNRRLAALKMDNELVVRRLRPRPLEQNRLTRLIRVGKSSGFYRPFVSGRCMIDDLNIDAAFKRALQGRDHPQIRKFIGDDAKSVSLRYVPDIFYACFQQSAGQPRDLLVVWVVVIRVRQGFVAELVGEGLARDRTSVEPDTVTVVIFKFGLDGKIGNEAGL